MIALFVTRRLVTPQLQKTTEQTQNNPKTTKGIHYGRNDFLINPGIYVVQCLLSKGVVCSIESVRVRE